MAALVQTFPAQQSTSSSSLMQARSQAPQGSSSSSQNQHAPRYTHQASGSTASNYRNSQYSSTPVPLHAFTATPQLSKPAPPPAPKPVERTPTQAPRIDFDPSAPLDLNLSLQSEAEGKNETARNLHPLSTSGLTAPPTLSSPSNRPSPDRYRRVNRRSTSDFNVPTVASNANGGNNSGVYANPRGATSNPSLPNGNGGMDAAFIKEYAGQLRGSTVDDMEAIKKAAKENQNRRKSAGPAMTTENFQNFLRQELAANNTRPVSQGGRPASSATSSEAAGSMPPPRRPGSRRQGSTDSSASGNSAASNRNSVYSNHSNAGSNTSPSTTTSQHEVNLASVPARGSSTEASKRMTAPSPLSKPVNLDSGSTYEQFPPPKEQEPQRPMTATGHLQGNLADTPKKGMKNRLRRAFSFGSAAELRKASAVNSMRGEDAAERARLRQEKYRQEQEEEQERIAQRQEASGLGQNIYAGTNHFFSGSTDNVSVSSTASSASIMIRKMGKGMKKSGRNLVGLFRPKSVTGVAPASGPVAAPASTGEVSMITVEAEREKVNVNAHPADQAGGGTGFPKLERNSLDMPPKTIGDNMSARRGSMASDNSRSRRSIVGGERERAEVLAAVRKGILKRSGSSSPVIRPQDSPAGSGTSSPVELPENAPFNAKPRSDSMNTDRSDYFLQAPRLSANSHSAPTSPNSITNRYNVSFSPRITFHETWPSGEYDRRGDIATCNRLTPVLAQQIKEELNSFKMEMSIHEDSRQFTHFF